MLKTSYELFAFTVTYFLEHSRAQETYVKNKLWAFCVHRYIFSGTLKNSENVC